MKDKKNNIKIDKKKIIKKENILIPEIIENKKNYQILIENNKKLLKELQKKNGGYIRHFDVSDNFPRADIYEADEDDIVFIKEVFKLKDKNTQKENVRNKYVKLFESCIKYLEETEDSTFENCTEAKLNKLSFEVLEKIHGYWIGKCERLKRPLLRKNWKVILTKDKYGVVDRLKKAFHQRESRMNLRKTNRITKSDLLDIQKEMYKETDLALKISELIVCREKLKYNKILALKEGSSKNVKEIEESIRKVKEKVAAIENHLKKIYTPVKKIEPIVKPPTGIVHVDTDVIKEPVNIPVTLPPQPLQVIKTNDLQYFFANTIKFLNDYGFKPEEFYSKNIENINVKIKKIKQGRSLTKNNIEKKIDRTVEKNIIKEYDVSDLILVKRQSFIDPESFYIDKIKVDDLYKNSSYNLNNFSDQSIVAQKFSNYQNDFSHFHFLSNNSSNPYSFNGKSNFIVNDEITEKLKMKRYLRFFDFYDHQTIDINPVIPTKNVEDILNRSVLELNLKNGKKNFLRKSKGTVGKKII